jgi:hypothetical protein
MVDRAEDTPEQHLFTREKTLASFRATLPWTYGCAGHGDPSEIEYVVKETGEKAVIASANHVSDDLDAEDVADFIVNAVNNRDRTHTILRDMAVIVEACLSGQPLSETIKRNADAVLTRLRALEAEERRNHEAGV